MRTTNFRKWVNDHRTVIIAGTTSALVLAGILVLRNTRMSEKLKWTRKTNSTGIAASMIVSNGKRATEILEATVSSNKGIKNPFPVKAYIKKLPEGCKASSVKITTSAENGFSLSNNTTWVRKHTRNRSL